VVSSPCIIVTGPTGIGKSETAIALAREVCGEILIADSQQIYRECHIGTGALRADEQGGIPHHGLACISPDQQWDVAQFLTRAQRDFDAIRARGRVPILVGGTGLYLRAFVYGLADAPPRDPRIRERLVQRAEQEGAAVLHAELAQRDPAMAAAMHPHHTSRIIRALEVRALTGVSLATWHAEHDAQSPRLKARWVGLTAPRAVVRERIAARVAQQCAQGWRDEVARLLARYGPDAPILQAIGYREIVAHLQEGTPWEATTTAIVHATQQYAKRQMTYLRKISAIEWIDVTQANVLDQIHKMC
jgi:tRNA dimethylallyltransferase